MNYELSLIDTDPINNMIIKCYTAREAYKYKKKAVAMGFKVNNKKGVKTELKGRNIDGLV